MKGTRMTAVLPSEIIFQILLSVSPKCVARFRCVSKFWNNMLTDSYFLTMHKYANPQIVLASYLTPLKFQSIDFENHDVPVIKKLKFLFPGYGLFHNVHFMGACEGLMLSILDRELFLWNFTTRVIKKLPQIRSPEEDNPFYGLGFNSAIDDYKVVRGAKCYDLQVYTRKADSWKTIQNFPQVEIRNDIGMCVNGFLHWIVSNTNEILSFDLAEETFQMVPQPDLDQDYDYLLAHVGALEGFLCAVYCYSEGWMLWVMKKYGAKESWTRSMTIPREMVRYKVVPLFRTPSGALIMQVDHEKIVKYDPKSMIFISIFTSKYEIEALMNSQSLATPGMIYDRKERK